MVTLKFSMNHQDNRNDKLEVFLHTWNLFSRNDAQYLSFSSFHVVESGWRRGCISELLNDQNGHFGEPCILLKVLLFAHEAQ